MPPSSRVAHRVSDSLMDAGLSFEWARDQDGEQFWSLEFTNDVSVELILVSGWVVITASANRRPKDWQETKQVFINIRSGKRFGVRTGLRTGLLSAETLREAIYTVVELFPARTAAKKRNSSS